MSDQDASFFLGQLELYVAAFALAEDIWRARARLEDKSEEEAWTTFRPRSHPGRQHGFPY